MFIIYIVKYVYSDIINNVKRTRQEKRLGNMRNEVLGNEKKSIKEHAESIIRNSEFYSKEEIEKTINLLWNDKRLSFNTKNNLRRKMIKILKTK